MDHPSKTEGLSRRDFVKQSAVAATAAAVGGVWSSRSAAQPNSPNEKLSVACIGVGGKGEVDMNGCAGENIVAICDVDESRLAKAGEKFPKARRYVDFRKMLGQKDIDAVTVSTPDHTHAPAAAMAMKLDMHVYCQKPLTHSIYEARVLRRLAEEHQVATQMGNQGHSHAPSRRSVEIIRSGALGRVGEVHIWTDRPIWRQGLDRPKETPPVPANLNWDLWLGPAPERPYHPLYHPFGWRGFWDFGCGALGDMGCHNMDIAFWSLELGYPTSVEAVSTGVNSQSAPQSSVIHYEFPARGDLPPVTLFWYDGGWKPAASLAHGEKLGTNGLLLVGEKGTMHVPHYWGEGKLLPEAEFADYKGPEPTLPRAPGPFDQCHYNEWIRACKGGPAALSNFVDYAATLTETVLLGNVALRVGKKIVWDAENMKAVKCPEADQYIRREYRKGWTL